MKMKKSKIRDAMNHGVNVVWCCNFQINGGSASPCKRLRCPYKEGEQRRARAGELKECKSFWITKPNDKFESAIPVLIHPNVQ